MSAIPNNTFYKVDDFQINSNKKPSEIPPAKNITQKTDQSFRKTHQKNPLHSIENIQKPSLKRKQENTPEDPYKRRKLPTKTPAEPLERQYPPLSIVDTMTGDESIHGKALCFQDKDILTIRKRSLPAPENAWNLTIENQFPISKTPSGKAVLQQQATRGCTTACVEMLKADHGKPIDWKEMALTNLGNTASMKLELENSGLKAVIQENFPFEKIGNCLKKNGSAIIEVDAGCGGHVIILDKIDYTKEHAYVRDPYHGWAIVVKLEALRNAMKDHITTIQAR